jgi:hypothetical protein
MSVACLHQPNFLPWTKLIAKVLASDIWIVYDSAQYTKTEFHSRQRIKACTGQAVSLAVPVVRAGRPRFQTLHDVELCVEHDWHSAHLRRLRERYQRTPFWPEVRDLVEAVYGSGHSHLVEFNIALARVRSSAT